MQEEARHIKNLKQRTVLFRILLIQALKQIGVTGWCLFNKLLDHLSIPRAHEECKNTKIKTKDESQVVKNIM